MATSWVSIANAALIQFGADTIMDLDEPSQAARLCKSRLGDVVDAVLRAHPWNAGLARARLAADSAAPAFGFARQFTLPTDPWCLRVLRLDDDTIPFKVEGRKLLTDAEGPLDVLYIARLTDPAGIDALLAAAIAARLAHEIAYALTNSRQMAADLWQAYEARLREARSIDGQEGSPEPIEADEFLAARI